MFSLRKTGKDWARPLYYAHAQATVHKHKCSQAQ